MEPLFRASAPTNAPVRIGVVGAGRIGLRHVELIRRSLECELAGVVDPDPRAARLTSVGDAPWYRTLDEMLSAGAPDGVIVATPNTLHVAHALRCMAAGIAVLVEKPIATTVTDGVRMAEMSEHQGVPLLVGHHRRYSPPLVAAREILADWRLGDVVAVTAATMFAKPDDYFAAAAWRRERGGGPILINLIHDVDALRMLLGDVLSVQAVATNMVRGFPVEETVAVTMRFSSGALGSLLLSDTAAAPLSWELTAGEDPAFPHHADRDCYVVAGTRGTLGIPTMRLLTSDGAPSWHRPLVPSVSHVVPADPMSRQLEHFCAVIRRHEEPLASGRDAVETLRVTLAVAEAAQTGRAVACGPVEP